MEMPMVSATMNDQIQCKVQVQNDRPTATLSINHSDSKSTSEKRGDRKARHLVLHQSEDGIAKQQGSPVNTPLAVFLTETHPSTDEP